MPRYSQRYKPKTTYLGKFIRKVRPGDTLPAPAKKAVTKVVNQVLARKAENKLVGAMVEDQVLHNSPIGPADCEPVIVEVSEGTDSRSRIGERITPKSIKVRGVVTLNTTTPPTTMSDIYVRLLILSQKDVKTGAQVLAGAVDTAALLRAGFGGGADQIAFDGDPENVLMDINRDKFRVYMDKTIKLSQTREGAVEQIGRYSAKWSYTFTKKNLPKFLTFDENNGDWCNNFAPFLAIGYSYSEGNGDTVGTKIRSTCYAQLQFEDM